MGLDGISVNQLRITPEFNSAELNNENMVNSENLKIVDGLSNGQRVDPDKEKEHESNDAAFDGEHEDSEEEEDDIQEEVTKYDLSDTNKYIVKLEESTNHILIIEKTTNKIIQTINADELSKLVAYLQDSCGSIVSKKF